MPESSPREIPYGATFEGTLPSSAPVRSAAAIEQEQLLNVLKDWQRSQLYPAWLDAQTVEEWDAKGPPETTGLDLKRADLTFKDLRGVKLSERFRGGADLNLQTASDLRHARLTGANLQRARLRGVKLQHADLEEANLAQADLCFAHLDHAILKRANLSNTVLSHVTGFEEAILHDVNFEGAVGLQGDEFKRADLRGARLPETLRDFAILDPVNDVSSNAQKTFLTMLLVCLYCWLTIATTSDAALLANSTASPLPVIQTPVPIAGFYFVAPLILIALFAWFHLYLQDMWSGLASLPAVFPDGKNLDERINPWLLTGFVRPHFKLLRESRPPLSRVKVALSIALAWWMVPLTLGALWLRYLPRHDWTVTASHVVLVTAAIAGAAALQDLARRTLRGEAPEHWFPRTTRSALLASAVGAFVLMILVSDGAINGTRRVDGAIVDGNQWAHRRIVPALLSFLGARAFADLSEASVSSRPANWFLAPRGKPLEAVSGATLRGADLRHATAQGAFLAKAVLHDANLQWANLRDANLEQADLRRARVAGAIFVDANLGDADLTDSDVTQAQLDQACSDVAPRIAPGLNPPGRRCTDQAQAVK